MSNDATIQIQITAGSASGRTLRLTGPTVTLGRESTCDVVADLPFVSRVQCEIREESGQWMLHNQSSHGTRLGRKLVKDKPQPIRVGDAVRVGDETVAVLTPIQAAADSSNTPAASAEQPAQSSEPRSGRTKLWIGIGIYATLMLGVIIVLATLQEKPTETDNIAELRSLTDEQIEEEIREPLPKRVQEGRMNEHLTRARQLFAMKDSQADALYRAHEAYQFALSYTPGDAFPDPIDQRRFQVAQSELIEQVTTAYRSAVNRLQARQFDAADDAFADLEAMYPADRTSALFRSIQKQRAAARRELDKR